MPTTQILSISGMTCGHCVAAVTSELESVPGVTAVEVDLATGHAVVTSSAPLDPALLLAAVDEAGYEIVS